MLTFPAVAPEHALLHMLRTLRVRGYRFTTPTPLTHQRVLARRAEIGRGESRDLHDVFGWNFPFRTEVLPPVQMAQMTQAGVVSRLNPVMPGALERPVYADIDRIAAVGLVVRRRALA